MQLAQRLVYSVNLSYTRNKRAGYTAFPGANHSQANAAVFNSTDLVEWFLSHQKI